MATSANRAECGPVCMAKSLFAIRNLLSVDLLIQKRIYDGRQLCVCELYIWQHANFPPDELEPALLALGPAPEFLEAHFRLRVHVHDVRSPSTTYSASRAGRQSAPSLSQICTNAPFGVVRQTCNNPRPARVCMKWRRSCREANHRHGVVERNILADFQPAKPGVHNFAMLATLEATARAVLISVYPILMYRSLGDARTVSEVYLVIGVVTLVFALFTPWIGRYIPRRYLYSGGNVVMIAGSLVGAFGGGGACSARGADERAGACRAHHLRERLSHGLYRAYLDGQERDPAAALFRRALVRRTVPRCLADGPLAACPLHALDRGGDVPTHLFLVLAPRRRQGDHQGAAPAHKSARLHAAFRGAAAACRGVALCRHPLGRLGRSTLSTCRSSPSNRA